MIEDLISTGGSSLQAVQVLKDIGITVLDVFSIFSYNLNESKTNFDNANCSYSSLTNYPSLLIAAKSEGYISSEEYSVLKEWYLDPKAWSDQFSSKNE